MEKSNGKLDPGLLGYTEDMRLLFGLLLISTVLLFSQSRPPIFRPPGTDEVGAPVPDWLGRGKTVTGHIEGIDPDRILLRTLGYGTVLFFVDAKTIVRVDKTALALTDLREGDAVAVKLKEIKGKGPYGVEIMAHPEVRRRKERGGKEETPVATPIDGALPVVKDEPVPAATPAAPATTLPTARPADLPIPTLPANQKGVTGAITEVNGEQVKVQLSSGRVQDVLVTTVTRIARAANYDRVLTEVRAGDRVAVIGDTLDSGLLVAREILVNRAVEVQADAEPPVQLDRSGAVRPRAEPRSDANADAASEFSGVITAIEGETLRVRTAAGKEREVLVTPVATVKRWGADVPLSTVRTGDQVTITGDVLDSGVTVARSVIVTKPVGR